MTKKDYILIEGIIARHNKADILHDFVVDLSNALYMNNDRFDTRKFLKACETVQTDNIDCMYEHDHTKGNCEFHN